MEFYSLYLSGYNGLRKIGDLFLLLHCFSSLLQAGRKYEINSIKKGNINFKKEKKIRIFTLSIVFNWITENIYPIKEKYLFRLYLKSECSTLKQTFVIEFWLADWQVLTMLNFLRKYVMYSENHFYSKKVW